MIICKTIPAIKKEISNAKSKGQSVGLVPTMGYLHEGHLRLIELIREYVNYIIVSIYVNPVQFGPNEDLNSYPRDLKGDLKILETKNVDTIFLPTDDIMYPPPYFSYVLVEELTNTLCGASRPGHFRGVATIVNKLFNICQPDYAIFGEKDFQQLAVIRRMVIDLNMPVAILAAPIVRETDGLAMSSRNKYLSKAQRQEASILFQCLKTGQKLYKNGERATAIIVKKMKQMIEERTSAKIDYVELVDSENLLAKKIADDNTRIALSVYFEKTRLIDNAPLQEKE